METAYAPDRIAELRRRTLAAIDELVDQRSDDPLAFDVLRAVRLARQNLEDQWLPLLDQIAASLAMITWTPVAQALIESGVPGPLRWLVYRDAASKAPLARDLLRALVERPFGDDVGDLVRAAQVTAAMTGALDDPQACLDVLTEPGALMMLASWGRLPADVVESFVVSGLSTAIAGRPDRLAEGYEVLRLLTAFTNGALDEGVTPGFARGVAVSLGTFLPTLAPAIRHEGPAPVLVVDEAAGLDVDVGSYDDLVDLVGVLLRDEDAQFALGVSLGTYARQVVVELGPSLTEGHAVTHIARTADLVADAAANEQVELDAAAAAESERRGQVGAAVSDGIGLALAAVGAGPGGRVVTGLTIEVVTEQLGTVEPASLPDLAIAAATYDLITVASITVVADRPAVRRQLGLEGISAARWQEVRARVDRVTAAPTAADRAAEVARLERWIDVEVPALAAYVARVQAAPGMDELTERRSAVGTD